MKLAQQLAPSKTLSISLPACWCIRVRKNRHRQPEVQHRDGGFRRRQPLRVRRAEEAAREGDAIAADRRPSTKAPGSAAHLRPPRPAARPCRRRQVHQRRRLGKQQSEAVRGQRAPVKVDVVREPRGRAERPPRRRVFDDPHQATCDECPRRARPSRRPRRPPAPRPVNCHATAPRTPLGSAPTPSPRQLVRSASPTHRGTPETTRPPPHQQAGQVSSRHRDGVSAVEPVADEAQTRRREQASQSQQRGSPRSHFACGLRA